MSVKNLEEDLNRFLNSFFNLYRDDYRKFVEIFIRSIEGDKSSLTGIDLNLVEHLMRIVQTIQGVNTDTLLDMRTFVEKYRGDYSYIYVVDCLGLPDIYALFYVACKRGFMANLKIFINIKGVTEPFKRAFDAETLSQVATSLQGLVIRRPDAILHSDVFAKPHNREELIRALVGRMKYVVTLIPLEKPTLVLSDHGYDIVREDTSYFIKHAHVKRPIFTKLAPALLLKR